MADLPRLLPLGDAALQIQLSADGTPDAVVNAQALALAARLRASALPLLDVVPAYASVTLHLAPGAAVSTLLAELPALLAEPRAASAREGRLVEVPVRYGGADGPELAALAASLGLAVPELVARHVAPTYRVAMLGFRPGFPYLLGLDPTLAAPRLATPRPRVPAGSVGIAGLQTGIYPDAAPGGWQLIGRTALRLFDPARSEPALLAPGDRLRFVVEAITA
jgi:KipI family sensor histidine kinase inhibitor